VKGTALAPGAGFGHHLEAARGPVAGAFLVKCGVVGRDERDAARAQKPHGIDRGARTGQGRHTAAGRYACQQSILAVLANQVGSAGAGNRDGIDRGVGKLAHEVRKLVHVVDQAFADRGQAAGHAGVDDGVAWRRQDRHFGLDRGVGLRGEHTDQPLWRILNWHCMTSD
jgi:hypothetical protein